MQIDLRALELLSSKICHDLISPVSAINNGVELIEEIGGDVVGEAMTLIGNSSHLASRKLKLFRFAYGRAGADSGLTVDDIRQIVAQYIEGGKITLNWANGVVPDAVHQHKGAMKVLVNLIMLAEESLAYGGTITLATFEKKSDEQELVEEEDDEGGEEEKEILAPPETVGCVIQVVGRNAHFAPEYQAALEGSASVEEITPRTIQAYISGRFADHYGVKLLCEEPVADRLDFSLILPPCES